MSRFIFAYLLYCVLNFVAAVAKADEPKDASAIADAVPLRVISFNIRYDNPNDGENVWPNRRDMVASLFRFHHIDAAGLQEVQRSQLDDLMERLPQYGFVGVARTDGKDDGEFTSIVYRKERLELVESGFFWLSETPETTGSIGWDAALPRLVTWGLFRDKQTERRWRFFNTHFDHVGKTAREESAKLLRQRCTQISAKEPFVITGDLNCREGSAPYKALTDKDMSKEVADVFDAQHLSKNPHYGPISTWNGFEKIKPGHKIDFVLVSKDIQVWQHGTLADQFDDRFLSDHFPVLAEITIGE